MTEKACPVCRHGTFEDELAIVKREVFPGCVSYQVACSCGVHGPDADTREEAIAKWNAMPRNV